MQEWPERQRQGIANAKNSFAERQDAIELRTLVGEWYTVAASKQALEGILVGALTIALAEEFERRGLHPVAEAVRQLEQREGSISEGRWLLAHLIGMAAADDFAAGLIRGEDRTPQLLSLDAYGAWETFYETLAQRAAIDIAVENGLWTRLDHLVNAVRADPGTHTLAAHKDAVRAEVNHYISAPDLGEAWETRLDALVCVEDSYLFGLAGRLSTEKYLTLLGRTPHPVFIAHAIKSRGEDLVRLLRAAPPAFDHESAPQHAGMIVIAILKECAEECRRKACAEDGSPLVANDKKDLEPALGELQTFVEAVTSALRSRDDAVPLALLWLERLVFEGERRGVWGNRTTQTGGYRLDPLMLLFFAVASVPDATEDRSAWIAASSAPYRIDRIIAALAAHTHDPNATGATRKKILLDLMVTFAPAFSGAKDAVEGRSNNMIGRVGAWHLLGVDDLPRFIEELWDGMRPSREISWRRSDSADEPNECGEIVALWAITAIEQAEPDLKPQLWPTVQLMLQDAMQTDNRALPYGFWPAAIRRLCSSIPNILPGDESQATQFLADFLLPHLEPNRLLFDLVFTIVDHGINPSIVSKAIEQSGANLALLATAFLEPYALRMDRSQSINSVWVDRVRDLSRP